MFKDSEYYKLERPRLLSPKAYSSTSQSCSLRLHHISTRSCHHDGATDVLLWKSHRDTNGPGGVLMPMSLRPRIKFWTRRYPPPSGAPKLEHGSGGSSHSLSEGEGGGRARNWGRAAPSSQWGQLRIEEPDCLALNGPGAQDWLTQPRIYMRTSCRDRHQAADLLVPA